MENPRLDPWWKQAPKGKGMTEDGLSEGPHARLFELVRKLDKDQSHIRDSDLDRLRLYSGRHYDGLKPGDMRAKDYVNNMSSYGDDNRALPLHMNVTRSAVDTAHAKICVNRPRMQILTEGGTWHEHEQARGMQRFLDGIFDECEAYVQTAKGAQDAKVFGAGFVKGFVEHDKIKIEWTWKPEIFVDEQACLTNDPREMYQRKYVPSEVVVGKFDLGTDRAALVESNSVPDDLVDPTIEVSLVEVVEAWHLPSKPGGDDGRHIICVPNCTLVDEPYEEPMFPLVKFEWGDDNVPYWKPGLVEECEAIQKDIDEVIQKVQRHMDMIGPWFEVDDAADIPEDWMTNEEFRVLPRGVGVKTPPVIHPQFIDWPFMMEKQIYNLTGISMMDAHAESPAGDISGKALRHLSALSSSRQGMKERHGWELPHLRLTRLVIRLLRKYGNKLAVHYSDRDKLEKIKWSEVALPEESYRLSVFPTGMLPEEPAGKIAFVQELVGMGWLDPQMGVQLLEMPDIDSAQSIKVAAIKHVQWVMDELVYKREWHAPDPIMDLDTGLVWARGTYLYCQQHSAPQDILDDLVEWIGQCKAQLQQRAIDQAVEEAKMQQAIQAATMPPAPPMGPMMGPEGPMMGPDAGMGLGGPAGIPEMPGGEMPIDESPVPAPLAAGASGLPPEPA